MKRADRKRIREAIYRMRCPDCGRHGRLEILTMEPLLALCAHCGWNGEPL